MTAITAQELSKQLEQQAVDVAAIRSLWATLFNVEVPSDFQIRVWLSSHSLCTVVLALQQAGRKYVTLKGDMSLDHLVRHISKVANTTERFNKILKQKEDTQCLTK
jgi:hypothetical protein